VSRGSGHLLALSLPARRPDPTDLNGGWTGRVIALAGPFAGARTRVLRQNSRAGLIGCGSPIAYCWWSRAFVIIYQHVGKLELEAHGVRAQAFACAPRCKGKGRVTMHHGLRDKECPRSRAWLGKGEAVGPNLKASGQSCEC